MKKFFILSFFGMLLSLASFAVAPITGASSLCVGGTTTLTDTTSGGTWASSNTAIATVGSSTGVVNGIAAGIVTISYITGTGTATAVLTVNPVPTAISGSSAVCVGNSITLTDATGGGSWLSGNPSLATVGSATGVVTGVSPGVLNIYYSIGGCGASKTVTVNAAPAPITGAGTLCVGATLTLADTVSGGTWSSSAPGVATVGSSSGIVTGVAAGTVNIYYLVGGCGTYKILTVSTTPAGITGSSTVCVGSSITLADFTAGGAWSSSATSVATVGTGNGIVTGVATGTSAISYTVPGCGSVGKVVTVTAAPAAITGSSLVCVGNSITLADATAGGAWSSSATSIATVNTTSGVVTGIAAGVATISYTVGGCGSVTTSVTVNAAPAAIGGPGTLCAGSTITLTDAVSGGTWSSSGASVATVGSTTGIVTGVAAGTVNIYYLVGGCGTYKIVTVTAAPAAITGSSTVCVGSSITLSDATGGGTWSSSTISIATVGSGTGIVTGVATGTANIYYSVPGCGATYKIVTVTAAPAAITGSSAVCVGNTITLADATPGGTWTSGVPFIATIGSLSGVVTGMAVGTVDIHYSVGGCSVMTNIMVNAAPAPISGSSTLCVGSTITLADTVSGGTWSSSNASVATVGSSSGIVTGVAAGTATIYYLVGGCGTYKIVTVTAAPAAITGSSTVCVGSSIVLADATTGGVWTSSATSIATVTSSGVVAGVAAGVATISYTVSGCGSVTKSVTVNAAPAAITGSSAVCVGNSIILSDATAGGTWISGNTSIATVGSLTGVVTGVTPGAVNIYYSVGGCGAYKSVTVNPFPTISGSGTVCIGASISLTASTGGGTWSTSAAGTATVGSTTGIVNGVAAGTVNIYYLVGGCGAYKIVTVSSCTGYIGGGISSGSPKATTGGVPVVGMMVRLKYASTGSILTQTYTDASGNYSFAGLADDDYYVYPEQTGYTTTPSATLTIAGGSSIFNNINFKVNDGAHTITPVVTAVNQVIGEGTIAVYPNPATNDLFISWENQAVAGASVIIRDVTGREVSHLTIGNGNTSGQVHVDTRDLTNGIYIISIVSGQVNYRSEVLVSH